MDTASTFGSIGGVLIVICQIPQLKKLLKSRSAGDISIETFMLLFVGQLMWFVYGILKSDLQITITNAISGLLTLIIIGLSLYYNRLFKNENVSIQNQLQSDEV
ncbi:hypothetical protein EBU95_05405 [bacterium]|nr:hypothetical protein [bacterium]